MGSSPISGVNDFCMRKANVDEFLAEETLTTPLRPTPDRFDQFDPFCAKIEPILGCRAHMAGSVV